MRLNLDYSALLSKGQHTSKLSSLIAVVVRDCLDLNVQFGADKVVFSAEDSRDTDGPVIVHARWTSNFLAFDGARVEDEGRWKLLAPLAMHLNHLQIPASRISSFRCEYRAPMDFIARNLLNNAIDPSRITFAEDLSMENVASPEIMQQITKRYLWAMSVYFDEPVLKEKDWRERLMMDLHCNVVNYRHPAISASAAALRERAVLSVGSARFERVRERTLKLFG